MCDIVHAKFHSDFQKIEYTVHIYVYDKLFSKYLFVSFRTNDLSKTLGFLKNYKI